MTANETRASFLKYFEQNRHRIVASSSLVPHDDPTLLFTNAGMNQFKDVFLGRERRDYTRAVSVQKCMRVSGKHNDLENVGPSLRHHTFFEMLGNFSFGDYFKKEAIQFAWELLTEVWKLPGDRLYATVFAGEEGIPRDEEAYSHWLQYVPKDRIAELGLADNFWAMGDTGPCGRCSEVHYFRGNDVPCPEPACRGLACSCDRFVEIWNNVFMEFDRQPDGTLRPLPAPSIDTGMGLERIVSVLQGRISTYDTDLFRPIVERLEELTGIQYAPYHGTPDRESDVSMRVIADHLRAMTFLIADGVLPSNEWRGYVLRKIMRRAMRHGMKLDLTEPFLHSLVDVLAAHMGDACPELRTERARVEQTILAEEIRFDAVLKEGLPRLESQLASVRASRVLAGDRAFRLYDTFGLPLDFIEDIASTQGIAIDHDGYERAMKAQRAMGRASGTFDLARDEEFHFRSEEARRALQEVADQFEGYTTTRAPGVPILALFDERRQQVDELREGQAGHVVLERTPFYLEAGGQVSDVGRVYLETGRGEGLVDGVVRIGAGLPRAHHVRVTSGRLSERDLLTAEVDGPTRDATRRNHTATHLLHAALREVLGVHVKQKGSLVAPDRLRFDFQHHKPVSPDELERIERIVNEQIYRNTPVETEVRPTEDAIAAGAMALFGEKYGDRVRVVSVPGFSLELCGGTHVRATGDIGPFFITSEGGVAAGVRRIEAITGAAAIERIQRVRASLARVTEALNLPEDQVAEAIERLQADVKRLTREVSQLKMKAAMGGGNESVAAAGDAVEIGGVRCITRRVEGLDRNALRGLADSLKSRLKSGVVVLAAPADGKVSIVVSVTNDLAGRVHAGEVVKQIAPIVGGGGGGRPDFAEAGGKDPSKVDEMLERSKHVIEEMLAASRPS